MNHKIKVLWCDRNIHSGNFSELLSKLHHLEVLTFDDPTEAKAALENDPSIRLIISGNLFIGSNDGLAFFKSLRLTSSCPQFLLFTGEVISDREPYLILNNFTYFHKDNYTPQKFELLIEELIMKSHSFDDFNLRIVALRKHLNFSEKQFASFLDVSPETVHKFENTKDIASSYIVLICNRFSISLSLFSNAPMELFLERLKNESLFELERKIQ
jgi:DNA-binding XRE family transcriptional regulator